jgi:sugar phosphate permease
LDADPSSRRSPETPGGVAVAEREPPRHRRIFYGWYITGAGLTGQTVQAVFYTLGAAALFLPASQEFGADRVVIAGVFAAAQFEGGLTGPIEGYLIHWFGPRRYMLVGWLFFGLGLIGIGLSQNVVHFYAAFLLTALGQSMAGFLPVVTTLMNWFVRRRGRAVAIFQMGSSVGAVFVPIYAWFVLNVGWRETVMAAGVIALGIGIPIALMMRTRPEDYGMLPDGAAPQAPALEKSAIEQVPVDEGGTIGQVLRSRSFWSLAAAHGASIVTWGALRVHEIPALVDMGLGEQTAANVFALTITVAAAGRLLGGFLGDYLGARRVLFIAILSQAAAMVGLAFASTLAHAVIIAIVFGIAFGARGTLMTLLRGEVFGRRNFSRLAGIMDPLSTVGSVTAPMFAAWVFVTYGSYESAFFILAAVGVVGALLLLGIRTPRKPRGGQPPLH